MLLHLEDAVKKSFVTILMRRFGEFVYVKQNRDRGKLNAVCYKCEASLDEQSRWSSLSPISLVRVL